MTFTSSTIADPPRLRMPRLTPVSSSARRRIVHGLLVFVTLVLLIDGLIGDKGLLETVRTRRQHRELQASIERLRVENGAFREQARRLREDPKTIESLAREELGLIRPGEVLFIVKDVRPSQEERKE